MATPAARTINIPELLANSKVGPLHKRVFIISALCQTEKNVSQLLSEIETTLPNMSQHLSTLYRAGVLSRRRDATQIYYRIGNERAATLCRAVCMQIALEADGAEVPPDERLTPQPGLRA